MFFKIIVLKMFANFIGNQLSLLITLQATRTATLLKRNSNKFFSVKFAKFLQTSCFTENFQWLLLTASGLQFQFQVYFIKKRTLAKIFFGGFWKIFKKIFCFDKKLFLQMLICNGVVRCQPVSLRKNSFTYLP